MFILYSPSFINGAGVDFTVALVSEDSFLAFEQDEKNIAIAYTVWSRKRGAGKEIINKIIEYAKVNKIERVVTLSPLTPMATHFHIRNGAKQISINDTSQNFEYKIGATS